MSGFASVLLRPSVVLTAALLLSSSACRPALVAVDAVEQSAPANEEVDLSDWSLNRSGCDPSGRPGEHYSFFYENTQNPGVYRPSFHFKYGGVDENPPTFTSEAYCIDSLGNRIAASGIPVTAGSRGCYSYNGATTCEGFSGSYYDVLDCNLYPGASAARVLITYDCGTYPFDTPLTLPPDAPPTASIRGNTPDPVGVGQDTLLSLFATDEVGLDSWVLDCDGDASIDHTGTFGTTTTATLTQACDYPAPGIYTASFTVFDTLAQSTTGFQSISVVDVSPPVASLGGPYVANPSATFVIQGDATDDFGITIAVLDCDTTNQGDEVFHSYSGTTTISETTTCSFAAPGDYTASFEVLDNYGNATTATAAVHINHPPTARLDPAEPVEGTPFTMGVTNSTGGLAPDDEDGITVYEFDCTNDGTEVQSSTVGTDITCTYPDQGIYTARLTVFDAGGLSSTTFQSITVTNAAPSATAAITRTAAEGEQTSFTVSASDVPDDSLTYLFDFGDGTEPLLTTVGTASHTYADGPESHDATITVSDGEGGVTIVRGTVTVSNVAPLIDDVSSTVSASINEGEEASFIVLASDVPDDELQYSFDFGDGSSPTLTSLGTITRTYAASGVYTTTVEVSDGDGGVSTITGTVTVTGINDVPVAAEASVTTDEDVPATATLQASDADGDVLTFALATAPAHGTVLIDAATGSFTYTPAANVNGADRFGFTVSDGTATSAEAFITVNVTPVDDAPYFVDPTPLANEEVTATAGLELAFELLAEDVESSPITYTLEGLPDGAVFTEADRTFRWTARWYDAGSYALTLTADDGALSVEREVSVLVVAPDSDGDLLPDDLEREWGLDPDNQDSDGDFMSDLEEFGLDPYAPRDSDLDLILDALDDDSDDDGLLDIDEAGDENLLTLAIDTDNDGVPNYRDPDSDNDGIVDGDDGCPLVIDPDQLDTDGDGEGDFCEDDLDGDTIPDAEDNCPLVFNPNQVNTDGDNLGDACDQVLPEEESERNNCGCSAQPSSALSGLTLLGLFGLGLTRRRAPRP